MPDEMLQLAAESVSSVIDRGGGIVIAAGAGMGVDSGLPDFRGAEGFWRAYPAYKQLGLRFEELANPQWFARDPELAWGFYGHRLSLYRRTAPHEGFAILQRWIAATPAGGVVFTSNVDGQFQLAGFPENCITEVHGSLHHLQCQRPACNAIWSAEGINVQVDPGTCRAVGSLPRCPACGEIARPNVLMFGDACWEEHRTAEQQRRSDQWLQAMRDMPMVVVECGAGTAVPTVRLFSESLAKRRLAKVVRINLREPNGPHGTIPLACGALDALRSMAEIIGI